MSFRKPIECSTGLYKKILGPLLILPSPKVNMQRSNSLVSLALRPSNPKDSTYMPGRPEKADQQI
jgi:hypothetical protein